MTSAKPISRRDLLKGGAGAAAATALIPAPERLAAPPQPLRRARSMADQVLPTRIVGPPPLPPLSVIAFNRLAFGPRPQDWAAWQALGATDDARLDAYVDQQLDPDAIDDSAADARIAAQGFETLDKPLRQLWADHAGSFDPSVRFKPLEETVDATWIRAIYSERQLFEVLVDFWHNHFNVYGYNEEVAPVFVHYDRDVIRANALGNFRTFIEAVGSSTAMLFYLDNVVNTDGGPNENYARELFELHTMGVDHYLGHLNQGEVPVDDQGRPIAYVDEDVYEGVRAFTGWTVNDTHWQLPNYDPGPPERYIPGTFLAWEDWHDRFQKRVLGTYLPSNQGPLVDGRAVYDLLAAHPGTARHVCTKLCRRFIADNPPSSAIDAAVAAWNANIDAPDQLKQVLRTIVRSQEFKTTWGQKVKRPFDLVPALLRASQAEWAPNVFFDLQYQKMGQNLFNWAPPDGYSDRKESWTSTNVMLRRWNFVTAALENTISGLVVNLLGQMPVDLRTSNQIIDWWIQRLMGREINAEDRQEIVDFLAQGRNPDYDLPQDQIDERTPRAVQLICMTPDFQYR